MTEWLSVLRKWGEGMNGIKTLVEKNKKHVGARSFKDKI